MFAYDIPVEVNGEEKKVILISYEAYQMNWVDEKHWHRIGFVCSEALFTRLTGETGYTIIDIQLNFGASEEDVEAIRAYAGQNYTFSDRRKTRIWIIRLWKTG